MNLEQARESLARHWGLKSIDQDPLLFQWADQAIREANDWVCNELRMPRREVKLTNQPSTIPFATLDDPRANGILAVVWHDDANKRDVLLEMRNGEQMDRQYSQWRRWTYANNGGPQFAIITPDDQAKGIQAVPAHTSNQAYTIRYIKHPYPPVDLRDDIMDAELPSYHDLVPLYAAILILKGDLQGGDAEQRGSNMDKLPMLEATYMRRKVQAFGELQRGVHQ